MTRHKKTLMVLLAACVFLSACTSSNSDTATPTETPTAAVSIPPEITPTPTPDPEAQAQEISDDELITVALAAYEADPQPEGTIAWDVLDSSVFEDIVSFRMCTWDGISAFDQVRDIEFVTTIDNETIEARNTQSSPTSGDCLNTQLIDSAIQTANLFEDFWESVTLAPETLAPSTVPAELFTDFGSGNFQTLADQWLADDVIVRGTKSGSIPEDLQAPLLWSARQDAEGQEFFELVACMPMVPEYGLYRGDQLLDDVKAGTIEGPHSVALYRLAPDPDAIFGWRVDGTDGSVWADCFNTEDWAGAISDWRPDQVWNAFEA